MTFSRISAADLRMNTTLKRQVFMLRQKRVIATRSGSTILQLVLGDRTGTIGGAYHDPTTSLVDSLVEGQGVEVSGRVAEFKGQLQVTIERVVPTLITSELYEDLLPAARRPMDEMRAELDAVLASVQDPGLSDLLSAIFDDPNTRARFERAPAAKSYHHACVGGLLEHTLAIVRLVASACTLYPELDALSCDLATTIALVHDLGKIRAYDPVTFTFTTVGSLWDHLYLSASMVERAMDGLPGFDENLKLRVIHGILAHHGRKEYGSPVLPMTVEAIIVNHADNLDGTLRGALDHLDRSPTDDDGFSEVSPMHDTRLYRG